jgi:citrate lyase subunit beta/citryl-CoA lyase
MLFVPGSGWSRIEKAVASAADSVCIDLEDSVTTEGKAAARANVIRAFQELDFRGRTRMFRMNAVDTPFAYRDLVDVVEAAGAHIDLVMLPKASSPDDVAFVDQLLTQIEQYRGQTRAIGIEAQIETADGFVWLREISRASTRLEALIFGPGDYSASLRMPSTGIGAFDHHDAAYPGHRWHAIMHAIVATARSAGLRCIDGPFAAYQDADGFARSCAIARALGFDGKQCIHPTQLAVANATFGPTAEEIAQAREIVAACEAAAATGAGAASMDGKMIDAASVRMARAVLEHPQRTTGTS